jgi:D-alanyl-lipoteichoic acid acyltransferase DltB (MBOAT superfamily)
MLFNSFEFAVFFPAVITIYFLVPYRHRLWLLLLASYLFYAGWNPAYLPLIWTSTAVDYFVGLKLEAEARTRRRRMWLAASLITNLALLFSFKYYDFAAETLRTLFGIPEQALPVSPFLLPIGISFYTFQTLSYTIDLYRGKIEAEPNPLRFALFVAFFPQLVAGPIERARNLLPQLELRGEIDPDRLVSGLRLILWGLFKKVVIADRLALFVDAVYGAPQGHGGSTLLLATYFFAFQIYCDFSGYSDIAIGCARILGIDLMRNFRLPYFATSISDFWRRWHISLSTWFRDYVYISLGGNRTGSTPRWLRNVAVVFVLSGLWHGANWTFVVWGALHGAYYLVEKLWARLRSRAGSWGDSRGGRLLSRLTTFHLVLLGWVFFRAPTVGDAWQIILRVFADPWSGLYLGASASDTLLGIVLIVLLILVQSAQHLELLPRDRGPRVVLPTLVRWPAYVGLALGILLLGTRDRAFIYFQF